jgi:hypothetical protein
MTQTLDGKEKYHFEHTKQRMVERHKIFFTKGDYEYLNMIVKERMSYDARGVRPDTNVVQILSREMQTRNPQVIVKIFFRGEFRDFVWGITDECLTTVLPKL